MTQENLAMMLAKLKDFSEMMIDLAYSSLLYGSEEIATHVLEMEEKMDILHTEFDLAVLKLGAKRDVKGLLGLIRLASASEMFADAAKMMADIVKKGVRAHPVVLMAMEQAEETIIATEIVASSDLCGQRLGELGLEDDIGMRIIAVKRCENWIYNPQDYFSLQSGDLIIARGYSEGREKLLSLADPTNN